MHTVSLSAQRRLTPEFLVICAIAAAYMIWLLSLPVFPSRDGPMHLFYANTLDGLLSASPIPFSHYFTLKHLPPPYSLYYYLLLVLGKAVPLVLADRLILCLYVAVFIFGFRYLAQCLGPSADRMTLLLALLTINWSVVMGFLNFSLSLGMAFVGLGLWYRLRGRSQHGRRIVFLFLVVIMMLTHPVPLAFMLLIAAVDLVPHTFDLRRSFQRLRADRYDVFTLLASTLSLLYIKLFTTSHLLQQREPFPLTFLQRTIGNIVLYGNELGLCPLVGKQVEVRVERVCFFAILLAAFCFAVAQFINNRRRNDAWTRGDMWLSLAIAGFVILPLIPHEINSSYFFADRLLLPVWIAPLIAACGWQPRDGAIAMRWSKALMAFAVIANCTAIYAAEKHIRPLATQISDVLRQPPDPYIHPGDLGLLLDDSSEQAYGNGTTWSPLLFAGAHVFRMNKAIIANPPWIYLPIMPFTDSSSLPIHGVDPWLIDHARTFTYQLTTSAAFRDEMMKSVNFVVIRQIPVGEEPAIGKVLESESTAFGKWRCGHRDPAWFWTCTRSISSQ